MIVRIAASIVLVLLAGNSGGFACSRAPGTPQPTQEELFSEASAVFVAHLVRVEEIETAAQAKDGLAKIEGTVRVIEVLKGSPPASNKIKSLTFGPGNCTIPLLAGSDYVLFQSRDDEYITWMVGSVGPIWNLEGREPQELLEKLRARAK